MSTSRAIAQGLIALVGRLSFSVLFIFSGIHKIAAFGSYVSQLSGHWFISMPVLALVIAIIFELLGGALVFFGLFTRYGAFLLFLFIVPMMFFMHSFWLFDQGAQQLTQLQHFLESLAIAGGDLYIMAYGGGKFSFDNWFRKTAE